MHCLDLHTTLEGQVASNWGVDSTRQHQNPLTRGTDWQAPSPHNFFMGNVGRIRTDFHPQRNIWGFHLHLNSGNGGEDSISQDLIQIPTIQLETVVTSSSCNFKGHPILIYIFHDGLNRFFQGRYRLFNLIGWGKILDPKNLLQGFCHGLVVRPIQVNMTPIAVKINRHFWIDGQSLLNILAQLVDKPHLVFSFGGQFTVANHQF